MADKAMLFLLVKEKAFSAQRRKETSQRRSVSKIQNFIDTDLRQVARLKDEDKFNNMIRLI
jgi:hypothetical protein